MASKKSSNTQARAKRASDQESDEERSTSSSSTDDDSGSDEDSARNEEGDEGEEDTDKKGDAESSPANAPADGSVDPAAADGKSGSSPSALILQLVGSFVGESLEDAVASVKSKASEQMAAHGGEYLEAAKNQLVQATDKVVAWGRKHPVQAVAAVAALVGVSAFLYATLRGKGAKAKAGAAGGND